MKVNGKKWIRSLLWILTGAMLVSAASCGNTDPVDSTPTPSETPTQEPTLTPTGEPTPTEAPKNGDVTLREYRVTAGTALEPDAELPEGLTEVVNRYMTEYDSLAVDGYVTTFQTGSSYAGTQRINTEAVMAYVTTAAGLKTTLKSWYAVDDYYSINLMMPINRDSNDYVKRDPDHYNDIQTDKNGKYITHSTSDSVYYMVPTEGWIEYIWEIVKNAVTDYKLDSITFEEPEMWYASGYSQSFKDAWEEYYDEEWQDQNASPAAMLKTMRLKVYLFDRILSEIARRTHELSPTTKIYVASHSTASYTSISITAGLNQYLSTGEIDGVIGQTWSNTASVNMPESGKHVVKEYENAFLGYASYSDAAGSLDLFAITDTMADGNAWTEQECFPKYRATLVSALMQSEIHRFEASVWPSRGFEPVSKAYKTIQLSCFAALNAMSGEAITTSAGTPGIAYLLSDSLSWQSGSSSWAPASKDSYYGVTLPLVTDGIPLAIKSMENVFTKDDLSDVRVLILAFDCQKPVREDIVDAIADWVKAGGTLLYIGGYDVFSDSEDEWWASYGSPVNALFAKLDTDYTAVRQGTDVKRISLPEGVRLSYSSKYANFYSLFTDGKGNGSQFVTFDAGMGNVLAVGVPGANFASDSNGTAAMRALVSMAVDMTVDLTYESTSLVWTKRGNLVAAHAFGETGYMAGRYLNLFDEKMTLCEYATVPADDSALYWDVTGLDLSVPRLGFSGGTILGDIVETAETTTYTVTGPDASYISTRLLCADGTYPASVTAVNSRGKSTEVEYAWDNTTDSLLVQVSGERKGVTVTVTWGKTAVKDKDIVREGDNYLPTDLTFEKYAEQYKGWKNQTVATTTQTADKAFTVKDTSACNGNVKYCDLANEIVYAFDLSTYPDAVAVLEVAQNYVLQVSADGKTWTTVANFEKTQGMRVESAANKCSIAVDSAVWAEDADTLYVRLSNSSTAYGWGGAIYRLAVYYR